MSSLESWNDTLEKIEGLREVHSDLLLKKQVCGILNRIAFIRVPNNISLQKLYGTLLEELNNELFIKSSPVLVEMKRQGSGAFNPFQRSSSDRVSSGRARMNNIKARRIYLDITTYGGDGSSKSANLTNG